MKSTMRWVCFALAALGIGASNAQTTPEELTLEQYSAYPADASVLLLGVFHFKDAGRDSYKPEVDVDILSPQRQKELAVVLDQIVSRFNPTRIALEAEGERAQRLANEEYPAYLRGELTLGANEIYQIGFRLGKRLGLDSLDFVDATGRRYPDLPDDLDAYARAAGQSHLLDSPWEERLYALYRHDDRQKAVRTLSKTLLLLNSPARVNAGHGHYVLGSVAIGKADEYPGADSLTGWWYNRNLRIFANIRRITQPGDRVLVVIGAGHLPILRHASEASPELDLVEVSQVLTAG